MLSVHPEDILLNLVYPYGPTRSRQLQPGSNTLYHGPRSINVYSVPETHRDTFGEELYPPLNQEEKDIVSRHSAEAAMLQVVTDKESHIGILAWSKPDGFDVEAEQKSPGPDNPGENNRHPSTRLLFYISRSKEQLLDGLELAIDMLEHQWFLHLGMRLTSAEARLYQVSPSYFRWSKDLEEHTRPIACYAIEFETAGEEAENPTPSHGVEKMPLPEHLVPSLRETVESLLFAESITLSYPYGTVLASAVMVAASGGNTMEDVSSFIQRQPPTRYGVLGIPITANPSHLEKDLLDVCEDAYIPYFLTVVEDWLRDHIADLPESLHPDTPAALKTLFNLACILHDAGAPYE